MKMIKRPVLLLLTITILSLSSTAWSANFWRTGEITRTLTESTKYGGCMVQLSRNVANGCPNSGWVSLDCDANHSDPGDGQRAYASALVALTLGKQVSVFIDNTKKNDSYCVARRLDILP